MHCSGSFVALLTPFDKRGRLDRKALEKLVEWHVSEGTDGIVCCATTGEGPCLTEKERNSIIAICVKTAAKRVPIVVGTGTYDTRVSVKYTEQAQKLGADGCLVVTPYYNKPSQRGCVLHFREVAKAGLPLIVYHIPPRAVIRLSAETIAEIARIPNVIGIKESSHDAELVRKISSFIPVLSGDDDFTLEIIRNGGVGSIGVIPNLVPRGWKQMIQWGLQGKWKQAETLLQRYASLCKALFLETNPQPVKYAYSWLMGREAVYRLPMVVPTEAVQQELKRALLHLALPQFLAAPHRSFKKSP